MTGPTITLGGRPYTLQVPTPGLLAIVNDDITAIAEAMCPPAAIPAVAAISPDALRGQDRTDAIQRATEAFLGGGVGPTGKTLLRAANSLQGLRKQFWRLTRKTHPELTEDAVAGLIRDEDRPDVLTAIDEVLKAVDAKKASGTGASG